MNGVPLPHLGPVEDEIAVAFVSAYKATANSFYTPRFRSLLNACATYRPASPAKRGKAIMQVIDEHLDTGADLYRTAHFEAIHPIVNVAASQARLDVMTDLTKAIKPRRPRTIGRSKFRITPVRTRAGGASSQDHIQSARDLTMNLVTHVNKTQRTKMRRIVVESFTKGVNPDITGDRVANVVGLFPAWQSAVDGFYMRMIGNDVRRPLAQKRARDYADELLGKRGIMIARTEIMRSMNAGREAGWHALADEGKIDPRASVKEWVEDMYACQECSGIGTVIGIDTPFHTDRGDITMPPLHPHCRCTVSLHAFSIEGDWDGRVDEQTLAAYPQVAELLDPWRY